MDLRYRLSYARYWLLAALRGECIPCNRRKARLRAWAQLGVLFVRALPRLTADRLLGRPEPRVTVQSFHFIMTLDGVMHRTAVRVETHTYRRPRGWHDLESVRLCSIDFGPDPVPMPKYQGEPRGAVDWITEIERCYAVHAGDFGAAEAAANCVEVVKRQLLARRFQMAGHAWWTCHVPRPVNMDPMAGRAAGIDHALSQIHK